MTALREFLKAFVTQTYTKKSKTNKNALHLIKLLFLMLQTDFSPICNAPKSKLFIEKLKPEFNYGKGVAINLRWGKKLEPTGLEQGILNRYKQKPNCNIEDLQVYNDIFIPKKIIKSDYSYICFHIDDKEIKFPHTSSLSSIPIAEFISNPQRINSSIERSLQSPNKNKKILFRNADYFI